MSVDPAAVKTNIVILRLPEGTSANFGHASARGVLVHVIGERTVRLVTHKGRQPGAGARSRCRHARGWVVCTRTLRMVLALRTVPKRLGEDHEKAVRLAHALADARTGDRQLSGGSQGKEHKMATEVHGSSAKEGWLWQEKPTFYGGDELHAWKLDKVHAYLERKNLDAVIFTKSEAVRYVSDFCVKGYRPFMDLEYFALVTRRVREPIVGYTSGSDEYRIQVRSTVEDHRKVPGPEHWGQALGEVLGDYDLALGRVGVDLLPFDIYLALGEIFPRLQIHALNDMWQELTCVKHPVEIEYIREAVHIVDLGLEAAFETVEPGRREYEVAAAAEHAMRQAGSEMQPFITNVASGVNGCIFERLATEKRIETGELVILDAGSVYRGYTGDLGRTVCVGKPSDAQRDIYRVGYSAVRAAVDTIRPGASCDEVDTAARKVIADAGYGAYEHRFATGHQLGWGLHGEPAINRGVEFELKPGMVVCVEPRVTLFDQPRVGGVHLEEAVLVTDAGHEVLSKCPFEAEMF